MKRPRRVWLTAVSEPSSRSLQTKFLDRGWEPYGSEWNRVYLRKRVWRWV